MKDFGAARDCGQKGVFHSPFVVSMMGEIHLARFITEAPLDPLGVSKGILEPESTCERVEIQTGTPKSWDELWRVDRVP